MVSYLLWVLQDLYHQPVVRRVIIRVMSPRSELLLLAAVLTTLLTKFLEPFSKPPVITENIQNHGLEANVISSAFLNQAIVR